MATRVRNISGTPYSFPSPYKGQLAAGAGCVLSDSEATIVSNLNGASSINGILELTFTNESATLGYGSVATTTDILKETGYTTTGLAAGDVCYVSALGVLAKTDAADPTKVIWKGIATGIAGEVQIAGPFATVKFTTDSGTPAINSVVYLAPASADAGTGAGKLTATNTGFPFGICEDNSGYAGSKTCKVQIERLSTTAPASPLFARPGVVTSTQTDTVAALAGANAWDVTVEVYPTKDIIWEGDPSASTFRGIWYAGTAAIGANTAGGFIQESAIYFDIYDNAAVQHRLVTTGQTLKKIVHTVTFSYANGTMRIYVDGTVVGTLVVGASFTLPTNMRWGSWPSFIGGLQGWSLQKIQMNGPVFPPSPSTVDTVAIRHTGELAAFNNYTPLQGGIARYKPSRGHSMLLIGDSQTDQPTIALPLSRPSSDSSGGELEAILGKSWQVDNMAQSGSDIAGQANQYTNAVAAAAAESPSRTYSHVHWCGGTVDLFVNNRTAVQAFNDALTLIINPILVSGKTLIVTTPFPFANSGFDSPSHQTEWAAYCTALKADGITQGYQVIDSNANFGNGGSPPALATSPINFDSGDHLHISSLAVSSPTDRTKGFGYLIRQAMGNLGV